MAQELTREQLEHELGALLGELDYIVRDTLEYVNARMEVMLYLSREDVFEFTKHFPPIWMEGHIRETRNYRRHLLQDNPDIAGLTKERLSDFIKRANHVIDIYEEALYDAQYRENGEAQDENIVG